jgi:uncharacterized protein (DUF1810 family)
MSRSSDLAQLLALRSLREERARTAVAVAASRLEEAKRAVSQVEAAIDEHEVATEQRERRFLDAMQLRPVSEGAIGRGQDLFRISDDRRDALIEERKTALDAVSACEAQLAEAQSEWRHRLAERDKLDEAHRRIKTADGMRAEAIFEQEAEEMSADRARLSC